MVRAGEPPARARVHAGVHQHRHHVRRPHDHRGLRLQDPHSCLMVPTVGTARVGVRLLRRTSRTVLGGILVGLWLRGDVERRPAGMTPSPSRPHAGKA